MPHQITVSGLWPPPGQTPAPRLSARQRGVLIAAGVANALIFLDQTAVVVALHSIQRDFHSSTVEVQWTIGAYLVAMAALVAGSGRLADLYGRRRLFVAGVALFGLSSAVCAAASSDEMLIIARVAQGAGAALTQPLVLAHATSIMPDDRRGWAIGVVASAGTTFLVLGPIIGGLLADGLGWRWIFLLNIPVVLLAIVLALRFMPESRATDPPPLDILGLLLLTAGIATLVAALLHMSRWPTGLDAGMLGLAFGALAAFVAVERRSRHPLLHFGLLGQPPVVSSIVALIAIQGAVLGVTVYLVLFLQNGVHLSATAAGATLIAAGLWTPLLSRWTGKLADRHGPRELAGRGLFVAAVGLGAVALAAPSHEALLVLPGLLLFGVSRPFVFTPASTGPVKALPASERGLASSLVAESRQMGAVLGVAALGAITAAFEVRGGTGASASGLEVAMVAAAAACLGAGVLFLALFPKRARNEPPR